MKFFKKPYTTDSIQKQFRELSKILHPDKKGDAVLFIEMQNEKKNLLDAIKKHPPKKPIKKKVLKKVKYKTIHIFVDGNDVIKQFIKQMKKWN
jgi:ABC-type hemin transport system substrate-binding protein